MIGLVAIHTILLALSILVLMPIAAFCIECLAAVVFGRRLHRESRSAELDTDALANHAKAAVLIPAHNEQLVIEQTVNAVFASMSETTSHRVLVVADNCDDQTADLARRCGAEVLVRTDPDHRGKGYAIQAGVAALREDPPDVVIVIDADCLPMPGTIDTLAQLAHDTRRPVQALNLTDRNPADSPLQAVSFLGNRFVNLIRPLGLLVLGLPCRLMGTGMAIPWRLIEKIQLAGGNLVEDMQLGIDLARQNHFPLFCPKARVSSALPPASRALVSQQTRWDHGHLRTAMPQIPSLLATAVRRCSWPLLGVGFDLSIPPLTFLVALWLGAAILAVVAWGLGASWAPAALLAGGGAAMAASLALGWVVFCRRQIPTRAFAAVPVYMVRKLPIYGRLLFHRQHAWVRTERNATPQTTSQIKE